MGERQRRFLLRWGPGIAVALVLTLLQLLWVAFDSSGLLNDDRNLFRAAACLEASWGASASSSECLARTPYPPLLPVWTALHFWVGGAGVRLAVASLWPFWLMLGLSAYHLAHRRAGVLAGITAACLATMLAVHTHLRAFYFSEIPLAAAALGALACWYASDGLRRKLPTALLAFCLATGLMCKWSFGFFLGPPMLLALAMTLLGAVGSWRVGVPAVLLVCLAALAVAAGLGGWLPLGSLVGALLLLGVAGGLGWLAWKRPQALAEHGRERLLGAGILVAAVGLLAGPWYLSHAASMQAFLASNLSMEYAGDPLTLAQSWFYYPVVAWFRLPTPLVPLLLLALVRSLWPGGRSFGGWVWWVLLSGTVILAVLPYRADRYLVPALPALAVPAVLALAGWRRVLRGVCGLLLAWSVLFHTGWIAALAGKDLRSLLPRVLDDVAPFGFPGNTLDALYLGYELLLESPWTFQLLAHAPKPYGEPWPSLVQQLQVDLPPGCPSLILLHCDGPCDWNLLEDTLYAAAPFANGRVANIEGPAGPDQLLSRATELAPFQPGRDAWPVNLALVQRGMPENADQQARAYPELGLQAVPLVGDGRGMVRLWLAVEPGPAVGCEVRPPTSPAPPTAPAPLR